MDPMNCPKCKSDEVIAGQPTWIQGDEACRAQTAVTCYGEDCGHEWTLTLQITPAERSETSHG